MSQEIKTMVKNYNNVKRRKNVDIAKTTIGLMFLTLISKVLGFFRELCLGSVYGASAFTDAVII